jgi:hypothetical protein
LRPHHQHCHWHGNDAPGCHGRLRCGEGRNGECNGQLGKGAGWHGVANTISPGVIHTEGVERVLRETAKRLGWSDDWEIIQQRWFEDMLSDKTVRRLGRVEEVADLVAFVSSPLADYINGANLRIDGGKSPSVN